MNKTLDNLVSVIGAHKVEELLWAYLSKNQKQVEIPKVHKKSRNFPLGARPWTDAETEEFKQQVIQLKQQGVKTSQICKGLAVKFHRTPSAIFNRLYILKLN